MTENGTESAEQAVHAEAVSTPDLAHEFAIERYRFILQQINAANENSHRFLALYQTLATTLASGAIAIFIGYRKWGIPRHVARDGIISVMLLITFVAIFTIILLIVGIFTWFDYRFEESDFAGKVVRPGFRERPRLANASRWYEFYIVGFIVLSVAAFWLVAAILMLPNLT